MRRVLAAAGRGLTRTEEVLSRLLLALLVLLVFVPAVTRTFNRPIIWSIEIAQLLFAWLAFLGANQAMRAGAHIGVDVLIRHLPPRLRRLVALGNLALIAAFLAALADNPVAVLFLILGFLVAAGMFVESTVMVLLPTPILAPIERTLGIDDVHFGVLMVILVGLGSMTPPVGVVMYTVCGLLDVKTDRYVRESLPFLLAILALLTVLALFPDLVLFLPRLVYGS